MRVVDGLLCLHEILEPFVETHMKAAYGSNWLHRASRAVDSNHGDALDIYGLLKTVLDKWNNVFRDQFSHDIKYKAHDYTSIAFAARNVTAHIRRQKGAALGLEDEDALRYLDAILQLVKLMKGSKDHITTTQELYDQQIYSNAAQKIVTNNITQQTMLPTWLDQSAGMGPHSSAEDGLVSAPSLSPAQQKLVLRSFNDAFFDHPQDVTSYVDYYNFHEAKETWSTGSGVLQSASYREIHRLWSKIRTVAIYEAFLLRFIRQCNGRVTRIFVLDGMESLEPSIARMLACIGLRHSLLEFETRFASILDMNSSTKLLGVKCDMFAIINGVTCLFFRFPLGCYPLMIRSNAPSFVKATAKAFEQLYIRADPFKKWYDEQTFKLSREEEDEVERQVDTIYQIARMRGG